MLTCVDAVVTDNAWLQLFFGGMACSVVYVVALKILRSNEMDLIWNMMVGYMRLLRRI